MFHRSDIKDICPNCETICSATDALCPTCGKNLDELIEKLPEEEQKYDVFETASKRLPFLTWLTPLFLVFSPLFVSLATILPAVLNMLITPGRGPLQLIWHVVPSSTLSSTVPLFATAIPLFLSTTTTIRAKLGKGGVLWIAALFSVLSGMALWLGLQNANMMTTYRTFGFFGILPFIGYPAAWVYWVIGIGIVLIVLNLMVIIGQCKTA